MNNIEYTGSRKEWQNCYYGIISKTKAETTGVAKPINKPVKMYQLAYRGQTIISSAPFGVCAGKRKELSKSVNYNSIHFKIERV